MTSEAATPLPKDDSDGDNRWLDLHQDFVQAAKEKEPEVLFLGDSHIALFDQSEIYRELFAPMHCICFGMRGDTTSNLLWRVQNGEVDFLNPKAIVVLIGSNNRGSASEILSGIRAVIDCIRSKQPKASIFVLKIPPRGKNNNPLRALFSEVNDGLQESLSHHENCHILDIDPGFVSSDGTIDACDMFDYLHFTNEGYKKAFESVYVALQSLLSPE